MRAIVYANRPYVLVHFSVRGIDDLKVKRHLDGGHCQNRESTGVVGLGFRFRVLI